MSKITVKVNDELLEQIDSVVDNRSAFLRDLIEIHLAGLDEEYETLAVRRRVLDTHRTALQKEINELQRHLEVIEEVLGEVDEKLGTPRAMWEYNMEDNDRKKHKQDYKSMGKADKLWDRIVKEGKQDEE